jgi:UDP-GlcNAc:undecaprenyl-phosphate/decaprenyl-phosphate GlcNAc-1-phosphate transferase
VTFALLIAAAGLSALATRASMPLAHAWGVIDRPGALKIHPHPTPRMGGVGFVSVVLVLGAALGLLHRYALAGLVAMAATGLADDRFDLRPRTKLAGQCLAGALLGLDLATAGAPPWLAFAGAALAVVLANSINLLDGMDGLAAGCSLIAALGLAFLARAAGLGWSEEALVAGGLLGLLLWNYPQAKTFMGDAGSLAIGYLLAHSLARLGTAGTGFLLAGAGTLSIPVFDVALGILRRLREGRPVFSGDRDHFYDQLQRRTGDVRRTLWISWAAVLATVLFSVAAPWPAAARLAVLAAACAFVAVGFGFFPGGRHAE